MSVYFKETTVIGQENIPEEGPIVFIGNHANQYIDAMSIVAYTPHHIQFMVAASTFRQTVMGFFCRMWGVIPVERPQDLAQLGEGKVKFIDSTTVEGVGTNFKKQAMEGDSLKAKGCPDYIVTEVISETQMKVKAKELDQVELNVELEYKIAPKVDQSQVFNSVWEEMSNGKNLGIFPEGGSHDQTDLLPLKVGVAICSLGCMSKYKDVKVKVVACGLKYFHPNKFRSRMIIEYSVPFEVDAELVKEYQTDKRAACSKFLAQVEKKMRSVTFTAPSYKELRSIYLARRLYLPSTEDHHYSENEINSLYKRFFRGYNAMRGEPEVEMLMNEVYGYGQELKSLGIRDSQVSEVDFNTFAILSKTVISLIRMTFSLLFVLPGMVTLLPLGIINRVIAEKERRKALKKSTVKIVAADVEGSTRMLYTFILYPLTCTFFTVTLFLFQRIYSDLSLYDCLANCFWFIFFYPVYNYVCIRSLDGVVDNWNNLFFRAYCLVSRDTIDHIRLKRAALSEKVHKLIDKFGPQVFEDFDKMKLVKNLKPKNKRKNSGDRDSDRTSESSFYQLIDEMDFDEAFGSLTELGI